MGMSTDEMQAWDQFYAAAVIAVSSAPPVNTGSPLDDVSNGALGIANRAAQLADLMLKQRKERYKR